jgi:hypothetical protein
MDWWTSINRVRALENMCYVVASNQAASQKNYPPFSWPGGSMIVDYDGLVIRQAEPGPGDRIVVAPIDLAALRHERERRRGHHLLAHLRTETYGGYQSPIYPPGQAAEKPLTVSRNDEATLAGRDARRRLRPDSPP